MRPCKNMLLVKKNLNLKTLNTYKNISVYECLIGNIKTKKLIIMESGRLEGYVIADEIIVYGKIIGKIKCLGKISVASTGSVVGDVLYNCLSIEKGAVINATSFKPLYINM